MRLTSIRAAVALISLFAMTMLLGADSNGRAGASVADRVVGRLARSPSLSGADVSFDQSEGVITHRGTVPKSRAKDRAPRMTAQIPDVEQVVNRMEIRESYDHSEMSESTDTQISVAVGKVECGRLRRCSTSLKSARRFSFAKKYPELLSFDTHMRRAHESTILLHDSARAEFPGL